MYIMYLYHLYIHISHIPYLMYGSLSHVPLQQPNGPGKAWVAVKELELSCHNLKTIVSNTYLSLYIYICIFGNLNSSLTATQKLAVLGSWLLVAGRQVAPCHLQQPRAVLGGLGRTKSFLSSFNSGLYGWLSKTIFPFWVLSIVRHLVFRGPKRDHNFGNHPYGPKQ